MMRNESTRHQSNRGLSTGENAYDVQIWYSFSSLQTKSKVSCCVVNWPSANTSTSEGLKLINGTNSDDRHATTNFGTGQIGRRTIT
jgi:hypothetical protein